MNPVWKGVIYALGVLYLLLMLIALFGIDTAINNLH